MHARYLFPLVAPTHRLLFALLVMAGLLVACGERSPTTVSRPTTAISVYTHTAGRNLDRDGYLLTLDAKLTKAIGVNSSVVFEPVALGSHTVELSGVADNCAPSGTPATVVVSGTTQTRVALGVLCMGAIPNDVQIAFVRDGVVYGMRADGSGITDLTGHFSIGPAWSPDGTQLAFVSYHTDPYPNGNIYVGRADGTGLRQLTHEPGPEWGPAWSPGGTKIVFSRGTIYAGQIGPGNPASDLYIVDADGSNEVNFTQTDGIPEFKPDWSPDGLRIVFGRTVTNYVDLLVRSVQDGSESNVTNDRDYYIINMDPRWSPDGTRLAFRRGDRLSATGYDIWLMNSDGSQRTALVAWPDEQLDPAWSPDGTRILFASGGDIWVVAPDGSGVQQLTSGPPEDWGPHWRPRSSGSAARPR